MNKKVAITLLSLCSAYLIVCYILKFAFPEIFLLQVKNETILQLGKFIEQAKIMVYIYNVITTFIAFYLFVCASRGKFSIKWYEALYILGASIINKVVTIYAPSILVHTSTSLMLLLALLCKGKMEYTVPTFIVYGFASQFLLQIRGFETIIYYINVVSGTILGLECWVWLFAFALLFKIREDDKKWQITHHHTLVS